jgi:hypothetical protein
MRNIFTLILLFTTSCPNDSAAQSPGNDSIPNRWRATVSYDVPRMFGRLFSDNRFGPVQLDGHYFLRTNFSAGLSATFSGSDISVIETYLVDTTYIRLTYEGPLKTSQYLVEGTYYFRFPDAEGRFLKNWNVYATLGLGIGITRYRMYLQEPIDGVPKEQSGTDYYFARQLTLGAEYRFRKNLGVFFETGFALSRLQFGASYTF